MWNNILSYKPEELFFALAKGKVFSKLELSQANFQLRLDGSSMQYVTINAHKGHYTFTRLPFGMFALEDEGCDFHVIA